MFWKQQAAFEFLRTQLADLAVFSFEEPNRRDSTQAQRCFLVTSYDTFWRRYRAMHDGERHYYELLPEGHVCRLYFDLEFQRVWNPAADDDALVAVFLEVRWRCRSVGCGGAEVLTGQATRGRACLRIRAFASACFPATAWCGPTATSLTSCRVPRPSFRGT